MKKMNNKVHVEGTLYQHTLELKTSGPNSKTPGVQFISGNVDIATDKLVDEMSVTAEPHSIVLDKNNNIWVLCSGGYMPPCEPALFCINPSKRQILKCFNFADIIL